MFTNENKSAGISKIDRFKVGISDVDNGEIKERGITFPWPIDPIISWVYYDCAVGAMLDSGIVVHQRLPQVDNASDSLGSNAIDDRNLDRITGFGVNLRCNDQYQDIVQRMGHARYWFRLWGQAFRVGYQIPIPTLKTIGGVAAIPYDRNRQWAYNKIVPNGNYGGVPLWHAQWSLWYTTAVPPTNNTIPAVDIATQIDNTTALPLKGVQVPLSSSDDNAQPNPPAIHR